MSNEECITLNKCGLERRKGIFSYEWFDSIDKLHETTLPPKEAFYSKLKQSGITDKEYKQAIDCWKYTKCETKKDYMMLYLKTDVLLSVDVFEKFRAMCLEYYEIDPCYTYSTPGLTWLCGLKYTNVRLKYYKENTVNIYDTIQHGIRGGLASVLGDCHVKCMNKQIDPEHAGKENYLKYLDFNSLYASAMVQALPTGEIKVCEDPETGLADTVYTRSSSNTGYIYTIDIKYNDELKQKTKNYPFFSEKTKANINQFTDYQNENKKKGYKPNEKLMLKLTDRNDYVIDGEMLDWYLVSGLNLEDITIKQKLEYSKSEWLKPYIEFNIQKRKEAKAKCDKFGDVFFKLMNNAFYGKTIENVYNRQDIELVNDVDRYIKLVENIGFKYSVEFDDGLIAVHKTSKTLSNEECITLNNCGLERRKGIFSYEWFDSIDKLHETTLPPKEAFYSKLKQSGITDKEYKQAIDCWKYTKCETKKDYMMLYLKTDVLLSVDVFEKFRAMCLEYYEIDPCYTYSTPGLTWLCGLKYTNVRLKYYKENTVNIYDTIQHGIRGGLASVLGDCHVKCMNKQIDPEHAGKENYLKYLDFNSLYASAMVQALPTGEIKVCEDPETGLADTVYTRSSSNTGYIYTIDIKYNDELKQKTKNYPFFSEKTKANINQFTDYQNENKKKGYKPNEKLMLKLTDKNDYVIDGEMLDWYLVSGLNLEDITIILDLLY